MSATVRRNDYVIVQPWTPTGNTRVLAHGQVLDIAVRRALTWGQRVDGYPVFMDGTLLGTLTPDGAPDGAGWRIQPNSEEGD